MFRTLLSYCNSHPLSSVKNGAVCISADCAVPILISIQKSVLCVHCMFHIKSFLFPGRDGPDRGYTCLPHGFRVQPPLHYM